MKNVVLPAHADPIQQAQNQVPLCAKALAVTFGVSTNYIYRMRAAGAPFWGRFSTVASLMEWLRVNPTFRRDAVPIVSEKGEAIASLGKSGENVRNRGITVL